MSDTGAGIFCPKCGAANAAGAAFCANCGSAMAAPSAASTPGGTTNAWPRPPVVSGGAQAQAASSLDPRATHAAAGEAVRSLGGQVLGEQPPGGLQFEIVKKSFWTTMGFALRYPGEVAVSPAGGGSAVRATVRLDWGSATGFIIANVILAILLTVTVVGILLLAILAYTLWVVGSKMPQDLAQAIVGRTTGATPIPGGASTAAPPPRPSAPPPVSPVPPRAPSPEPPRSGPDPHDQLKRLKALHDDGVLTDEEYAAKKAEILARL